MITFYGEGFATPVPNALVWTVVISSLVLPVALYILRAIGLYVLAKRREVKGAFLAFLPFVWIYLVCRLVAETKFLKTTVGKLAILLTIVFTLSELLALVYNFVVYFPLIGNYLVGNEIIICSDYDTAVASGFIEFWIPGEGIWYREGFFKYPYQDLYKMVKILDVLYWISLPFELMSIIIEITLLLNLFKKYWPERFVLAFIMSVFFGLTGIFIFIIRKKNPVNYNDYLRSRYQAYGPYGYYYGPRPPHGPYGPYGQNPNANRPVDKGPFEDYASPNERTPEEPFSEYNNDKKDKDGE